MNKTYELEKPVNLMWLSPSTYKALPAGVAYYNPQYGEYFLKIDEEPADKQYFLKTLGAQAGRVNYAMELVIKNKEGRFLKRQKVGEGYKDETTNGCVYIDFGSKYKTLVLNLA